jgi:hypothetical protein
MSCWKRSKFSDVAREKRHRGVSGGGPGALRRWCCRPARGPDRKPRCRPRTGPAWVPWRIGHCPLTHQMMCYTKPLKSHTERVRPQFLSLRQSRHSGLSFSAPRRQPEAPGMRAFAAICPNQAWRPTGPFWAVFRLSAAPFSDATEPRPFWYGCWNPSNSTSGLSVT